MMVLRDDLPSKHGSNVTPPVHAPKPLPFFPPVGLDCLSRRDDTTGKHHHRQHRVLRRLTPPRRTITRFYPLCATLSTRTPAAPLRLLSPSPICTGRSTTSTNRRALGRVACRLRVPPTFPSALAIGIRTGEVAARVTRRAKRSRICRGSKHCRYPRRGARRRRTHAV